MKPVVHQYEDKLLEFAYGELTANEESAVSAHVQTCAKCSEALAGIKGVRASMRQLPMEAAPEAGLDSLLAYAEQAAQRNAQGSKKSRSVFSRWVGGLSAVAALGLVAYVTIASDLKAPNAEAVATAAKKAEMKSAREYGEGSRKQAEAPSPAPVAAAPAADKAVEADGLLDGKVAAKPSTSRREAVANALGGGQGIGSLGSAGSGTGSTERAKEQKQDEELRLDFGNAMARGGREPSQAYVQDAKKAGPKNKVSAPAEEKLAEAAPSKISKAKEAPMGLSDQTAPAAAAPSLAEGSASERQESMGLSVRSKSSSAKGSYRSTDLASDDEALQQAPSKPDRTVKTVGSQQAEVDAALATLKSGATGSARSEALKRLCDAFDASGDETSADTYCGLLLKEFPNSAAAKAVVSRQEAREQAGAKAKAKTAPASEPAKAY